MGWWVGGVVEWWGGVGCFGWVVLMGCVGGGVGGVCNGGIPLNKCFL